MSNIAVACLECCTIYPLIDGSGKELAGATNPGCKYISVLSSQRF